jgi:NADP-dependent 3-hydroxy acid dehydrogenase YdfG
LPVTFDVRNRGKVFEAIENIPDEWQGIDILINNAGLALGRDYFDEADIDDWETMIDSNVKGLLYVSRAVIPYMVKQGKGHIINLGSIAGTRCMKKETCIVPVSSLSMPLASRCGLICSGTVSK